MEQAQAFGESAELGRRSDAQLEEDLGAVRLDGALGDPQLTGDLLVETSGHDELEDLALPRGEGGEARAQLGRLLARRASAGVEREGAMQRLEEDLALDREPRR